MITHKISRGFDIPLAGACDRVVVDAPTPQRVAVEAADFPGLKAKMLVAEGDRVQTGQPLFFDKKRDGVRLVSPGTGKVVAVELGARRALQRVVIELEDQDDYCSELPTLDLVRLRQGGFERSAIVEAIVGAGLWPLLRQRPIGKVADPNREPVAVYLNGMDTEPLAADPSFLVQGQSEELQAGVDLLRQLTSGQVYLTVRAGEQPKEFEALHGVEMHGFKGAHPAGLVGTHIRTIRPMKADESAYSLRVQDAVQLGRWLLTGHYPTERMVAVVGEGVADRRYVRTRQGADLRSLMGRFWGESTRTINGTVLSGRAADRDGSLGFYAQTLTCILEGEGERDLFGWMIPQPNKLSFHRAMWSWILPRKKGFSVDARVHGGPRAIVNIGAWEAVTALDIHPTYLVRAIQSDDLEEAISLGLLEVTEEDVALCTFVDPCKIDVGAVIRKGLDLYEAEG
ncbi:MAG: NADH:ubiquinone reductase (Na(+)-transporting) subunit A [Planctomycetota bacterium]